MKKSILLYLLVVFAMVLAACAPAVAPAPTQAPVQADPTKAPQPTQAPEATKAPEPTKAPEATQAPEAGLPEGVSNLLTVKLRQGIQWSDGTPFTSKDLVGTYNIYWAKADASWTYLKDVVAKDDYTVEFQLSSLSPRAVRLLLRANQPAAYSQYGKWMDQAGELRQQGLKNDSDEVKKFLDDLFAFKPETAVSYGPFVIDPGSITEAQLELVKNPGGYNADKIDFEKILVYYGETAATVPLVLAGEIDYATHGFTPSDVQAFQAMPNIQIVRGPTGTGPGLWFNHTKAPFDKKEVRQAFAYIIDRDENAKVALGESGKALKFMAGFTDLQVETWLEPETIAKLNPYEKDLAKAEELLTSIGFKKVSGKWADDQGQPIKFELSVPSDFADWLGSAENAAQQLKAFGFDASVRGFPSSERATTQKEGKYDILVDLCLYYNPPHPQTSFNYYLNTPRNAPEAKDALKGFNWSWKQQLPDGTEVYVPDLLKGAAAGLDPEAQKPFIAQLAILLNEELPVLALFERYANDPINTTDRVTGWLPLDDKIYKNSQADNYISYQLVNGILKPAEGSDKSFHTSWPYPQPPNYDLNYFTSSSLPYTLGSPEYHAMYTPLFWYMWDSASYEGAIAESYELK